MDHLEEIKARLTIEEVVSQYVQLQKAGRNFKGLCPFHNEKTPSFMVSPAKGLAYCFGCHQGGDIFKFIQLIENIEFSEAVKILAEKAGVELPTFSPKNQQQKRQIFEINEEVARFFQSNLKKNSEKTKYLIQRGLTQSTIDNFRLGYATDSFKDTYSFLLKKGFTKNEIVQSGLAIAKDTGSNEIFDRFRGRIIFPISNVLGKVIAFGGRILVDVKDQAKYLNSPDSPTYNKSLVVYALDKAKETIRKLNQVIIVEGYMDVIASHQANVTNVVASSGTALTSEQIKLLKRYTNNFIFAFDTDEAGKVATKRAINLAIEKGLNVKIALIPNAKDPDECIAQDVQLWKNCLQEAVSVFDFVFNDLLVKFDQTSIDGKKKIVQEILPLIQKFPDRIEQEEYLKIIANKLQVNEKSLRLEIGKIKQKVFSKPIKSEENPNKKQFSREEYLLGLILLHPNFYTKVQNNLIEKIFKDENTKKFYKLLKNAYNPSGLLNLDILFKQLSSEEELKISLLQVFIEDKYGTKPLELIQIEVDNLIKEINRANLIEIKQKLVFDLKEFQKSDKDKYMLALNQYNQILKLDSLYRVD